LFQPTEVIPIKLGWISNQAAALELVTSCAGKEFGNIRPKDVMEDGCNVEDTKAGRASDRQKKVPPSRTDDLYGNFKPKFRCKQEDK
jgi:hypothetical protein